MIITKYLLKMPARKWCFVPKCTNTSTKTPQKIFVTVPITSKRREKWFAAARRDIKAVSLTSALYCCEDHFDIENDMDNYIEYKMSKVRARMNPDAVPHKFTCQPDVHLMLKKKREFGEKRARHKHIVEYLQSVAGPSTEKFDLEETNVIQPSEEGNFLQHISTLRPQRILHDKSSHTKLIYFRSKAVETTKKSEKTVSLSPIKFLNPLKKLTLEPPKKHLRIESEQASDNSQTATETSDSEFCQQSQCSTKSSISDIDQLTVKTEQEHIRGRTLCTMPGCGAINCTNSSEKGFSMKRFPRDPDRRRQWQIKNRRDSWTPTNNSYLCEIHFATDMWEKTREDGSRKLKNNAVPTIFPFSTPKKSRKHPTQRTLPTQDKIKLSLEDVPTLLLSKETENTVAETWNHVKNNGCSNEPMGTVSITESEVKLEYDEESWRNNLLLEKRDLQISVEPKLETGIFDLFNQLWTGEYTPILPSRAWAIHFIESGDGNIICLSKLIKIGDNTVCGKEILISNSSINLYVYNKLYEIGNLNLTSLLICIESFQSILESFDNLKLNSMMEDSNNSTSIYDFQYYGTNNYERNVMPLLATDIKVEPDV